MNEGALTVRLELREGAVDAVQVKSSRQVQVTQALAGCEVEPALRRVRAVFAVCGMAHLAAAQSACEAALGVEPDDDRRLEREVRVALEALDGHALQICAEWPRVAGAKPVIPPLQRVRVATEALRRWLDTDARPPFQALEAELLSAARELAPDVALAADDAELLRWASRGEHPAAAWMREILEAGASEFGASHAPLLSGLEPSWVASRLREGAFSARPTLDGRTAEAGAIARASEHPAVVEQLRRRGRGLLARIVARLADVRATVQDVQRALAELRRPAPLRWPTDRSGQGAGVSYTARGPLAHSVQIEGGRVVRWASVAPTEWTFHPHGVLREALLGAPARGLQRRAEWLMAALDPCVPWRVELAEARHA